MKPRYFCTACGLCTLHHDGPLCSSEPGFACAWDPVGFDLTTVIRSAGGRGWIPHYVTETSCPYCLWNRPMILNMSKPRMTFTEGVWERAKNRDLVVRTGFR